MEILGVDALSSSQLLVVGALALFATIIFSSIYIRIRGQYRGRNKLPDHTQKKRVFGGPRSREPNFLNIPKENHEVVTGARPKAPVKSDAEEFQFDFDVATRPTGPIEHVATNGAEHREPEDRSYEPIDVTVEVVANANGNGTDRPEYDDSSAEETNGVPEFVDELNDGEITNDGDEYADVDQEVADSWVASDDDEYDIYYEEETSITQDPVEEMSTTEYMEDDRQDGEYEFDDEVALSNSESDDAPSVEYAIADELLIDDYEEQEDETLTESNADEHVVPFDHRTSEAKRVGTPPQETTRAFSVVSVCLISDDEGQIYRDIRGEHLAAFLNKRGFIYLDEEYHLKEKSTVERGAIRVRNYEATSIGSLVKENQETCGFRLYFRPGDCADALTTLNEMLKIANLSKSFFSDVCAKPLVIYDGRKDSTGSISPFTQEDYNALKQDLNDAFPKSPEAASKRTAVTRNEYAPSEDLPTRAEQY